jgi:hypothetical protein
VRKREDNSFQHISVEIVYIINSALENNKAIAACHLQSNDILIIFREAANAYKTNNI